MNDTKPVQRVRRTATTRRRLSGYLGDGLFLVGILAMSFISVVTLLAIASALNAPSVTGPGASSAPSVTGGQSHGHGVVAANERVYHLPGANPELMNPAIDPQGRVWFGEMGRNKLAMLDPKTGKVSEWTPPDGQYNIMTEVVDKHGFIWFTEEAANYLGRFDPASQTFRTYPLNTVHGTSAGPEALTIDAQGNFWFTEVTASALGRLDPTTGKLTIYPLPASTTGSPAYPYALITARDGRVWYGDLTGGSVGWLDPATGKVTQYATPNPKAEVYTMAVGPSGAIWYTTLQTNTIGRIDPATGTITRVAVPATAGAPATLYSVMTQNNSLWLTSTGANALVRYTPSTGTFTFYTLKQPQSVPFGLAIAPDGTLWFTADGAPNYIGAVHR